MYQVDIITAKMEVARLAEILLFVYVDIWSEAQRID
jgi:hypothetical protein